MGDFIEVDFRNKEQKKAERKEKLANNLQKFKGWVVRNREALIIFTPIVIKGVTTVTKVVGKNINLRKEEAVKNLYCYDNKLGHYWRLKRELSNKEWLDIERRKQRGENLGDILDNMRVLK